MASNNKRKPEIKLKVAEARQEDVYRGVVRIDAESMRAIGVKPGDVVEIEGKRKTVAVVDRAYPEDVGLGIIRMDGIIRRNAKASLGEYVTVRKADVKEARKVIIAPARKGIYIEMSPDLARQALLGRPLMKGDLIILGGYRRRRRYTDPFLEGFLSAFEESFFFPGFSETRFVVVDTVPKGPVMVTEETDVEVLPHAVEVKEETIPEVTYEDIGDMEEVVRKVRELVELPLKHPEIFERLGIEPPKGILLHGPPGTGKTLLAKAVANEAGAHFIAINGPEIVSKFVGESEKRLREIFEEAEKNAPSIIFIDEIDAIAPKRDEAFGEVERRLVAQLLTLMDGLKSRGRVIVIAATNRPNAIDPALRRPGRFDREIEVPVPDERGRYEILKVHTRNVPLGKRVVENGKEKYVLLTSEEKDELLKRLAKMTHGYVGADLAALVKEAAMNAIRRVVPDILEKETEGPLPKEILEKLVVTEEDFKEALKVVPPSALREVLVEVPNVRWSDIGGLEDVKKMLKEMVEWPLKYPELYKKLGIEPPKGILLFGPPGTGKTLLAKAVATEAGMNFITVRGPEVLSKWVGESIPGDEIVLAKIEGVVRNIKIKELYEEWRKGKEIEVPSITKDRVKWSKIYKISRHLRTSPLVEIITESGRKVKVTLDHSVFTVKNGRIVSVPTSELKSGDWIVMLRKLPSGNEETINGIRINENIAELIGLYIAEGDINGNCIRIHTKDPEIIKEIDRIVREEGLEGKYYNDGSYWIKSKWFVELCRNFGVGSKMKRLGIALSLKKGLLAKVLKGYFSGDGSFYLKNHRRSGRIEAVTVSKELANDLLVALSIFGIFARIKERVNRVGNLEFRISFGKTEELKIFLNEIGFIQERKNRKLAEFIKSRKWTRGLRNIPVELVGKLYANMEVDYYSDRVVMKKLKKVLLEDLYFDRIKEIRILDRNDNYVYDVVEVEEGHNFVGGQCFLLHNSERAIREVFRKARQVAPCVVFFDEIDAIAPRRGMHDTSGVTDRIVNQLLTELDGITTRGDVVVMAATNRPDILDPALLRPGRFDRIVFVPPPDKKARIEIFKIHTRNMPLDDDVNFEKLAEKTELYSGADIAAVCKEAALIALREKIEELMKKGMSEDEALKELKNKEIKVSMRHFEKALEKIKPSIRKDDLEAYLNFMQQFSSLARKEDKEIKRYFG